MVLMRMGEHDCSRMEVGETAEPILAAVDEEVATPTRHDES